MNTLDDLRTSLDRHASGLADPDLHARPVAVRERVRTVRRRRHVAATAAAAVVVAALVGGGISLLPGDASAPRLAVRPDRIASGEPVPDFPAQLGDGSLLVDDVVGTQGKPELAFRVRVDTDAPRWMVSCAPAGSGWFTLSINGVERMFGQCGTASGETSTGWVTFDNLERADGSPLIPGDTVDVEIRLLRNRNSSHLASGDDLRLGVGVYEMPAPAEGGPQG